MMQINNFLKDYYFLELKTKLFLYLRLKSCPFGELVKWIPQKGSVLDIGCGYGLLPIMLAQRNPKQKIVGVDIDEERIEIARKAGNEFGNLRFWAGDVSDLNRFRITPVSLRSTKRSGKTRKKFDVITIVDVLYLLPIEQKKKLLQVCFKLLKDDGKLIIKINDKSWSIPYFLTWLQEKMTVFLLHKTKTKFSGLFFESPWQLSEILLDCKLKPERVVKLKTPFPFFHPHWMVITVK